MRRGLFYLFGIIILCDNLFGQTADDALRFSELQISGTARGIGVAGAFGAMGADFTSVISNPAGLAFFRKSDLMFSLRLDHINNNSTLENSPASDDRFNFNLGNLGVVLSAGKRKSNSKWKAINFGLGYNRLASYHSDKYYRAGSSSNSVLRTYAQDLDGTASSDIAYGTNSFESVLAYDAYLLNPLSNDQTRYSAVTDGGMVDRQISVQSEGSLSEMSLSVAANYNHKIYFGGYLGIPFIVHRSTIRNFERNSEFATESFNFFEMSQQVRNAGVGVNFKMGVIYRPNDWVRFGVALHSPTLFGMNDEFNSSVASNFDTINYNLSSPFGEFRYNLSTPLRTVTSFGLIFKKYGFFSFDYEWVDYSRAKFRMDNSFKEIELTINSNVNAFYRSGHIMRMGVEAAIENFRLRAGFAHHTSPYSNAVVVTSHDGSTNYYTFGAGVRLKKVYVDVAYLRGRTKAVNFLVANDALDETIRNSFVVTTGFRF